MNKAIKKSLSIFLAIIVLICMVLPLSDAFAADFLEGGKRLTVILKYGEDALRNLDVGICRVATGTFRSDGKVVYTLTPDFEGVVENWPAELRVSAEELRDLAAALMDHAIAGDVERVVERTGSDGTAVFDDLQTGLYLVMQENQSGASYRFAPSLAPVGRSDAGTTILPKTSSIYSPPPEPTPSTPTPSTPPPTPTPSLPGQDEPVMETEVPDDDIPDTTIPRDEYPSDNDDDIPDTEVPQGELPPIPQTGVIFWELIIIVLTALGVSLLVIGLIQKRRNQEN